MLEFVKMQGAGNDFIVFDAVRQALPPLTQLARAVCSRHFGVGADGLLAAGRSDRAAVRMIYYNADGSKAAMCGNGLRCLARFARECGLAAEDAFAVETAAGVRRVRLHRRGGVIAGAAVEMGRPRFAGPGPLTVSAGGAPRQVWALSTGVPHAVLFVPALVPGLTAALGPEIEHSPQFLRGINVDFVEVLAPGRLRIETWERGAGHTLACGTGCCAAAAAARRAGLVPDGPVRLLAEGGTLRVTTAPGGALWLWGGAAVLCRGTLDENLV